MRGCSPAIALLTAVIIVTLGSCKTTQYVPVETVRTEIEYRDRLQTRTDSIHITDSVYVKEKGDTVLIERWRTSYRDRLITDTATVYIERVDSVQVPYPVATPLTKWQQFKQDLGGIAFGVSLFAIVLAVIWLIRMIRSRKS